MFNLLLWSDYGNLYREVLEYILLITLGVRMGTLNLLIAF
jgi:hypothetical protein